jgi:hypothetical protein
MVIATIVTTTIASFYFTLGWVYLTIIVPFITSESIRIWLWVARTQNTIDLSSGKGAFGDKNIQCKRCSSLYRN